MFKQIKYPIFVLLLSYSLCAQNQYYLSSSTENEQQRRFANTAMENIIEN